MRSATLTVNIWTTKGQDELPVDTQAVAEMFAPHLAHVHGLCEEGYTSGDVCDERFSGWWSVDLSETA